MHADPGEEVDGPNGARTTGSGHPTTVAPGRRRFLRRAGLIGAGGVLGAAVGGVVAERSGRTGTASAQGGAVTAPTSTGPTSTTPTSTAPTSTVATPSTGAGYVPFPPSITDAFPLPGDGLVGTRRIIWDVRTPRPLVALTFDDGPDPRFTPRVLDTLRFFGVRATFFMLGAMAERHPDLARRVLAEGHEVGNHSYSHRDLSELEPAEVEAELARCRDVLESVLGVRTPWFRPPRGRLNGTVNRLAARYDYDTVLWSAARGPEEVGTPGSVAAAVLADVRPGAVVDLHDSIGRGNFLPETSRTRRLLLDRREVEMAALPLILERAASAGLRFVPLTELVLSAELPGAVSPSVPAADVSPGPTGS